MIFIAHKGKQILQDEVYKRNVEIGISKCAETVNNLDNIIYFGENIVNFVERDYRYLLDDADTKSLEQLLVSETYSMINEYAEYFMNLYVSCDGRIISTSLDEYEAIYTVGRPWYDSALGSKEMIITNPYKDIRTGEDVVTISKRIGDTNCVVGLDIALSEILNILKDEVEADGPAEHGYVINQDGIIVAHTDEKYVGISLTDRTFEFAEDVEPYLEDLLKSDSGQIMFDGKDYAYALVHQKSASGWHVIYSINKKAMNIETVYYRNEILFIYGLSLILLNSVINIYYFKRLKAIKLKERAESAEKSLIEYKNNLEELVLEKTEDIRLQGEKIKDLNTSIIDNLADIVEFRDLESGQHIKRIKNLTYCLATKMAEHYPEYVLTKENIDIIHKASALHDIGKIAISDSILLKPSKLSPEEYDEIKKHTAIGGELVSRILEKYDSELAYFAQLICRYHHERYDGNGYPDGLKGENIPISAQIVALADVYDALTEKRVYKKEFAHEEAIQMIKNGECGVFSEKLLHCLELIEDEFDDIRKEGKCT